MSLNHLLNCIKNQYSCPSPEKALLNYRRRSVILLQTLRPCIKIPGGFLPPVGLLFMICATPEKQAWPCPLLFLASRYFSRQRALMHLQHLQLWQRSRGSAACRKRVRQISWVTIGMYLPWGAQICYTFLHRTSGCVWGAAVGWEDAIILPELMGRGTGLFQTCDTAAPTQLRILENVSPSFSCYYYFYAVLYGF